MTMDLFHLGPYSNFIWPAYGISALALCGMTGWVLAGWYRARKKLSALEKTR